MDDEAHLRAIRANIDDDGPRLVYADVLSERGDPQGELIVVQCARARLEREGGASLVNLRPLLARERELFDAHVKEWVNPFGLRRWWGDFERGFIARLSITVLALRSKWENFQRLPLREIVLRPSRNGPPTLDQLAWMAHENTSARELTLETGAGRATFDFRQLAKALESVSTSDTGASMWSEELPHRMLLPALRKLGINYPTRAHLQKVTASHLELEELHINDGTPFLADDMRHFVDSQSGRSLRDFWVGFIEDEVAIALFEAGRFPALRSLGLTRVNSSRFSPDVGAAFSFAKFLPQLTSFRSGLMLDERVARALSSEMPALDALHLLREAAPGGIEALLRSELPRRLRRLSLTGAGVETPYPSASVVTRAPFEHLIELTLSRFLITEEDANALPPVFTFHALECEYGPSAKEALKQRWPFVRTT